MFLLIHTMTVTERDCMFQAHFFHAVSANPLRVNDIKFIGRRLSLRVHPSNDGLRSNRNTKNILQRLDATNLRTLMKRNAFRIKHQLRAVHIGNLNQQSRNNVNQIQSQIEEVHLNKYSQQELSPATSNDSNFPNVNPTLQTFSSDQLIAGANPQVTTHWLTANRFDKYLPMFTNFSGADMLRMTRDDLIQICGKADGIRLYNSLHSKAITPTLTLYISRENATFFNAIFLYTYNNMELLEKLSALVGIPQDQIRDIYMLGPQSIHIHVNSDVIKHIKEDTTFNLEVIQDSGSYIFVLKSINKQ